MKNIIAKINYWTAIETGLWIMTALWFFLGAVGFITLSAEETMSCMDCKNAGRSRGGKIIARRDLLGPSLFFFHFEL